MAFDAQTGEKIWTHSIVGVQGIQAKNGALYAHSKTDVSIAYRVDGSTEREYYRGLVDVVHINAGKTRAEIRTEGIISSAPVFGENLIYVKDEQGILYASETVQYKWKFKTEGEVWSSPAVVDGTVFFGSNDHNIYAVNAENGKQIWRYITLGAVQSSPAVVNGTLYVGSNDGKLYAIEAHNGVPRWNYDIGGKIKSSPLVVNGTVYVGSTNGQLVAIDTESGKKDWSLQTIGGLQASPAFSNGRLYIGSLSGYIYSIDAETGQEVWKRTARSKITWSSPAVANKHFFVGTANQGVLGFTINGRAKWQLDPQQRGFASSAAYNDGYGAVGTPDGTIFLFTWKDGVIQNTYRSSPLAITSSPAMVNGVTYVGGNNGLIHAVNSKKGLLDWQLPLGGAVTSSPAISDGVLYVGSHDGNVYAIE